MIGDPSGRNSTRPPLTREQIEANAETYFAQASMVLDRPTEIRYNSEWSDPLGARGMIQLARVHRGADDGARRLHQALQGRPRRSPCMSSCTR
jgi:tyrosyl-tRNA synthetase